MQSRKVSFENSRALKIAGVLDYPDGPEGKLPAVVIAHGFGAFKEYTPLVKLSRDLVSNSFVTLRFDFSNCIGESEGKCEDMMLSHQVNDLASAINYMKDVTFVDPNRIGVVGHSLGGLTCIVTATTKRSIKAIVTVSSPASFNKQRLFKEDTLEEWKEKGVIKYPNWKKGHVDLHYSFVEDLREYDASKIVKNVKAPIMIIHGTADDVVPIEEGRSIFENANEPKEMKEIEGADHYWKGAAYKPMSEAVVGWMKKHL